MKFWDYDKSPFRPVPPHSIAVKLPDGSVTMIEQPSDVFLDGQGRIWYAGTDWLRVRLSQLDPEAEKTIPPMFWHPSSARQHAAQQRIEAEDARADLAIPKAREWVR